MARTHIENEAGERLRILHRGGWLFRPGSFLRPRTRTPQAAQDGEEWVLVDGTTLVQRKAEELTAQRHRRLRLMAGTIVTVAGTYLYFKYLPEHHSAFTHYDKGHKVDNTAAALFVTSVITGLGVLEMAWRGFWEILYLVGFPHMHGARIRDPRPVQPDMPDFVEQAPYGRVPPNRGDRLR